MAFTNSMKYNPVYELGNNEKNWSKDQKREFIKLVNEVFDPNQAARGDFYVRRTDSAGRETIDDWVEGVLGGQTEQIFLTGDSGVGKTNLLLYWADALDMRVKLCGISEDRSLADSIENELVRLTGESTRVFEVAQSETRSKELGAAKGIHLRRDRSIATTTKASSLQDVLEDRLAKAMYENGYRLIIFDNLQNLPVEDLSVLGGMMERFADLKNTVEAEGEKWAFYPKIAAAGVSMNAKDLIGSNPSRARRIESRRVDHMSEAETSEIAQRGFDELDVQIDEEALKLISFYSDGFPFFVKQICNATAKAWAEDSSTVISVGTVKVGVNQMTNYTDDSEELQLKAARGSKRTGVRPRVLQVIAESEGSSWTSTDVVNEWPERWGQATKSPVGLALNQLTEFGLLVKSAINKKTFEYSFANPRLRSYIRRHPIAE